jgi:hypothetical protein
VKLLIEAATNIDPIRYDLLFERFLNPERVSMPDFDVDYADRDRGRMIEYVKRKYGEDHVCQIIRRVPPQFSVKVLSLSFSLPPPLSSESLKIPSFFTFIWINNFFFKRLDAKLYAVVFVG